MNGKTLSVTERNAERWQKRIWHRGRKMKGGVNTARCAENSNAASRCIISRHLMTCYDIASFRDILWHVMTLRHLKISTTCDDISEKNIKFKDRPRILAIVIRARVGRTDGPPTVQEHEPKHCIMVSKNWKNIIFDWWREVKCLDTGPTGHDGRWCSYIDLYPLNLNLNLTSKSLRGSAPPFCLYPITIKLAKTSH